MIEIDLDQEENIENKINDIYQFDKINHISKEKFKFISIQNRKKRVQLIFRFFILSRSADALMCVCETGLDFEKLNSAITWLLNVISVTMISIKNSSVVTKHSTVARHTTRTH